jgi:pyruvate formate lyase activating enzyme
MKFDLKFWDETLNIVMTGVSNKQSLKNFENIGRKFYNERKIPPLLTASTLLIPGYIDEIEVKNIAEFIASINQEIPYTLLAFYPQYVLNDLPTTSKEMALKFLKIAREAGLKNVKLGNVHLLK